MTDGGEKYELGFNASEYGDDHILWDGDIKFSKRRDSPPKNARHMVVSELWTHLFKDHSFSTGMHHLNLVSIVSNSANSNIVSLEFRKANDGKKTFVIHVSTSDPAGLILALRTALKRVHGGAAELNFLMLSLTPELMERTDPEDTDDFTVAKGVGEAYRAYCSFYKRPWTHVFQEYVDSLTSGATPKVFDLTHCPGVGGQGSSEILDVQMAFLALMDDRHFNTLCLSEVNCNTVVSAVGGVLKSNRAATRLILEDIPGEHSLASWLPTFPKSAVQCVSFCNTHLNSRAFIAFAPCIKTAARPFVSFDFTNCKLSSRAVRTFLDSIRQNEELSATLKHLSLSGNSFDSNCWTSLAQWFDMYQAALPLESLGIANTGGSIDYIKPYIEKVKHLQSIDLSGNSFNQKNGNILEPLIRNMGGFRFFGAADMGLTPHNAACVMTAFCGNRSHNEVALSLARNNLGRDGALVLARAARSLVALTDLDLSDNHIPSENLIDLLDGLQESGCLRALWLCNNVGSGMPDTPEFTHELMRFANTHPTLAVLDISTEGRGRPVKDSLTPLFEELRNNSSLRYLGISGYGIGDVGASMLCEALKNNKTLTQLVYDRNQITVTGWECLALALKTNGTMQHMPLPQEDFKEELQRTSKSANPEHFRRAVETQDEIARICHDHFAELHTPEVVRVRCIPDFATPSVSFVKPPHLPKQASTDFNGGGRSSQSSSPWDVQPETTAVEEEEGLPELPSEPPPLPHRPKSMMFTRALTADDANSDFFHGVVLQQGGEAEEDDDDEDDF